MGSKVRMFRTIDREDYRSQLEAAHYGPTIRNEFLFCSSCFSYRVHEVYSGAEGEGFRVCMACGTSCSDDPAQGWIA